MKRSLLLLLVLSSASLQDVLESSSQHNNVSLLNLDLEETAGRPTITPQHILSPAKFKQKRQANPSSSTYETHMRWRRWKGFLPDGAVSIYNDYSARVEYVCEHDCWAGFYSPKKGAYCHYSFKDKEYRSSSFFVLVNEDNFENLQWKDGSYGSVPPYSAKTCSFADVYVGRNKYGLGKVHVRHEAFFLPWEGSEYYYKYYQVLTLNMAIQNEHMSDIKYDTTWGEIIPYPPENIQVFTMKNNECKPVQKTTTLSKTISVERRWKTVGSVIAGVRTTFSGGVPLLSSGSIGISSEMSFQFSVERTNTEENNFSSSVAFTVPPNHSCEARMVGYKYKIKVPFTARLSRTYRNGVSTSTSISGMYEGFQYGEVRSEVDRCTPLRDAKACP